MKYTIDDSWTSSGWKVEQAQVSDRPRVFPDNYMWTLSTMHVLNSMSHVGAAGEVLSVCLSDRMQQASKANEVEVWVAEWTALGARVEAVGDSELARGATVSAGESYQRASLYFQIAERFLPRSGPVARSHELFAHSQLLFRKYCALRQPAPIEVVTIPYEDSFIEAYLIPGDGAQAEPKPCVVFLGGLEAAAEWMTGRMLGLALRGVSCLVLDAPGYGAAIRFRGQTTRHDYEVVASAAVDYLGGRGDIDSNRLGVLGISLGGYFVTRAAAFEPRFKAAVAWGAIWDYEKVLARRAQMNWNSQMPVAGPKGYAPWVFGVGTFEEAVTAAHPFKLEGVAQNVRCSYLLIHGREDKQVLFEDATALFEAVGSDDKEFCIFTDEDTGAEHCQWDNTVMAQHRIFDFFADKL